MSTSLMFIRKMVRDRLGVPMHDSYFPDPLIDANINLAILAVEETQRWPWNETLETVEVTGESIDVPSNWRATKALVNSSGNVLDQCVSYELVKYRLQNHGEPAHFCIIYNKIHLAPVGTGQQLTHYYYRSPQLLNNDEDVLRMPAQHVGTVVAKASQLCSTREDDRPSAVVHLLEFEAGIERMRKDTRATTRPQQKYIRPGAWV